MQALFIGDTGSVSGHAVTVFRDHGYDAATLTRSGGEDEDDLTHVEGDRNDRVVEIRLLEDLTG